MLPQSVSEVWP